MFANPIAKGGALGLEIFKINCSVYLNLACELFLHLVE